MMYEPQENFVRDDVTSHVTILNLFYLFTYTYLYLIISKAKSTKLISYGNRRDEMM